MESNVISENLTNLAEFMSRPAKRRKRKVCYYSKSDLSRLIDSILHPIAKGKSEIPILIPRINN